MMKRSLNRQDIEALSAFLDGQLPGRERRKLEARLRQEPDLKQAYEDMRLTRAVLRRAPRIKRRRNFILTPEMVKQRRTRPGSSNVLQFVSVMAMILFGVFIVTALFSGGVGFGDDIAMGNMEAAEKSFGDNAPESMEMEATEAPEEPAAEPLYSAVQDEDTDEVHDEPAEPPAPAQVAEGDAADDTAAEEDHGPSGGGGVDAQAPTATPLPQPTTFLIPTLPPPGEEKSPDATETPSPTLSEEIGEAAPLPTQEMPAEAPPLEDRGADDLETTQEETAPGDGEKGETAPAVIGQDQDVPLAVWIVGGVVLLAVLGGVIAWVVKRRGR